MPLPRCQKFEEDVSVEKKLYSQKLGSGSSEVRQRAGEDGNSRARRRRATLHTSLLDLQEKRSEAADKHTKKRKRKRRK